MTTTTATIVVRVEPSLKQQCERIAATRDETLSQVLRRALREYAREHSQLALTVINSKQNLHSIRGRAYKINTEVKKNVYELSKKR
jgi:Ribbon-helix-helix protein